VCSGSAGLAPEERVELLAVLALDKEDAISSRAQESLLSCAPQDFIAAMKRIDAAEALFRYCAENLGDKPGVADAMADNLSCPAEYLIQVAPYLKDAVDALVEDLDRLSSNPGLVTALAPSANLTAKQRAVLDEIQRETPVDEAELAQAVEGLASVEPDKAKRLTLVQKVARMRVVERMQLALKGNRDERMLLIRDPNRLVQRAVLQSPKLSEQEVEGFAGMTSVSEEVLRIIATNRNFIKSYTIVRALMFNPKTPLDLTLHMLARLNPHDLKFLTTNKNIPETLRSTAMKLVRQRALRKGPGE
jgi:hypothetical protein